MSYNEEIFTDPLSDVENRCNRDSDNEWIVGVISL